MKTTKPCTLAAIGCLLVAGCSQPHTGASVWKLADDATTQRADAVAAINSAKRLITDNLCNVDCIGYRAIRCRVIDGKTIVTIDNKQGPMENTSRSLDIAISGNGFFKVKSLTTPTGVAYTRCGNFFVNDVGELVLGLAEGYKLEPRILIPRSVTEHVIATDGRIEVQMPGGVEKALVGQIELTTFAEPDRLAPMGKGVYAQTPQSGEPVTGKPGENGTGQTLQNYLEGSNVEPDRERLRLDYLNSWRDTLMKQ